MTTALARFEEGPLRLTWSEWNQLHRSYRTVDRRGRRFALRRNPVTGGTELWPVVIVRRSDPKGGAA